MYKFVYGFLLVIVLGSSGCSDWLDVQPKTSVPEEDLFADEFGFQDALTGFYLKMGESSLYGRELTYNYMEMLAGRYEYAPDITNYDSGRPRAGSPALRRSHAPVPAWPRRERRTEASGLRLSPKRRSDSQRPSAT